MTATDADAVTSTHGEVTLRDVGTFDKLNVNLLWQLSHSIRLFYIYRLRSNAGQVDCLLLPIPNLRSIRIELNELELMWWWR